MFLLGFDELRRGLSVCVCNECLGLPVPLGVAHLFTWVKILLVMFPPHLKVPENVFAIRRMANGGLCKDGMAPH